MKNGKAAGISDIHAEMLKTSGDSGMGMETELSDAVMKECTAPADWLKSVLVNTYNGNGDAHKSGTHRGLKMKVQAKVFETLRREGMEVNEM